jgi:hypothetical protein
VSRTRIASVVALLGVGAGAIGLAYVASLQGGAVAASREVEREVEVEVEREVEAEAEVEVEIDAGSGTVTPDEYLCVLPDLPILHDPRCETDASYPACRWQLPDTDAAGGLYVVWRSTTPDHRWARPGLVTLAMAAAREYQRRWPGEHLTIGDLDAAGPRHQSHDRGVDVDLYLDHAMLDVNEGPHRQIDNYATRTPEDVASLRARVTDLAHILAICANGRLRIYYNDPEVLDPFVAWFAAHGFVSDVGPAMTMHNRLHRFHFHMTVPEDLPPIAARLPEGGAR